MEQEEIAGTLAKLHKNKWVPLRRDARQIKDLLEKESRFTPIVSMQVLMIKDTQ